MNTCGFGEGSERFHCLVVTEDSILYVNPYQFFQAEVDIQPPDTKLHDLG